MASLDNLKALFGRRRDAEQAMEHPGVAAAFEEIRARAIEEFVTSRPHQVEEREDAYQRLRALALVRQEMQQAIARHEFAQAATEAEERRIARRK